MSQTQIADLSELLLELGLAASCTETERAIVQACLKRATSAVVRHLKYNPMYSSRVEFYPQSDFRRSSREVLWQTTDTLAYEETLATDSTNELQVTGLPIRSITSLKIDYDGRAGTRPGSFGSESVKTEGVDFWPNYDGIDSEGNRFCKDGIIRSEGVWPNIAGSVRIEYFAGYKVEEFQGQDSVLDATPILEAVIDETVRRVLKQASRAKKGRIGFVGPLVSESLGDYSYSSDTSMLMKLVGSDSDILSETAEKLADFTRYDWGVM